MTRLLLIEDDESVRAALVGELRDRGHEVTEASTGAEGLERADEQAPGVVVLDLRLPDRDGLSVLDALREREDPPEVIILTAHGSIDTAVQAVKRGAFDFLEKPCRVSELEATITRAAETSELRRENRSLRRLLDRTGASEGLVGDSPAMAELAKLLGKVAPSDLPVLILGETGCGKELVARSIHQLSPRAVAPFVAIDCGTLQSTLIESELFGHERGAFTGADRARPGLVEAAGKGTLFLDEIGELDLDLQSKLLRLLESGEYRRLGGTRVLAAEARFLAATNRDLAEAVEARRFRNDLFYRLNVLNVTILPLRERPEDVPSLAEHFLSRTARRNLRFSEEALGRLRGYGWPGNVRELRNIVERMALLVEGDEVTVADLPPELGNSAGRPASVGSERTLADVERDHILGVLDALGGNKSRTARALGISPGTLYNKLERYRSEGQAESD